MISVLYDHAIFATQPRGGISRYYAELLPRLRDHGVAAHLFLGLHICRFAFERAQLASVVGIRRPTRGTTRLVAPINAAWFRRRARAIVPQIYHATSYADLAPPDLAARRVVTVHDLTDIRTGHAAPGSPWSVSTAIARRVDGFLCISERTRQDLIEIYDVDPALTALVHHASDLTPPADRTKPARPYVLHVGGRGSYKNFDGLFEAFAHSPRLRGALDLYCFGPPPRADEHERAARAGVRLTFGAGDDRALAAAYANARAFVYPSLYEGFGIPLLEAMRCDCPVVCSDASSFPEVADDAAEYFDPREPASIAAAIERVAFDDARRNELIARGRVRREAFTWDRAAAETAAFYRRVLER